MFTIQSDEKGHLKSIICAYEVGMNYLLEDIIGTMDDFILRNKLREAIRRHELYHP